MTPKCGRSFIWFLAVLLVGCDDPPPCQFAGVATVAASAGCLVLTPEGALLVESPRQQWGPPGGTVDATEPAQCAAARETWEETGLAVTVDSLARRFENGFHLYWCAPRGSAIPRVRRPFEVHSVGYFAPEHFSRLSWRYAGQGEVIEKLVHEKRSEQDE